MNSQSTGGVTDDPKRAFVLDTSVLMHDPTCIFRFDEHDIHIPMIVLEELDADHLAQEITNAREDVTDAKTDAVRQAAETRLGQLQEVQAALSKI